MIRTYHAFKALRKENKQSKKQSWYKMASVKDEAEVYIYDEIGYWGVTAKDFVRDLVKIDAKKINLHLNTPGGSVFDGVSIYNALVKHKAEVETHIDGLAASMGSIIALAGNTVNMAKNAFFMIHNPWSFVVGDAETMRKEADLLDKISASSLVNTYAEKSGLDAEYIKELMDDESWLNAEEAEEYGFVDNITGESDAAAFDLSCFNKAPDGVVIGEAAEPPEPKEKPEPKEVKLSTETRRKRLVIMEL